MKLFSHIISKKLDAYNDYLLKKLYSRAFWQFFQALNVSLAFLKINNNYSPLSTKEIKLRNVLYSRLKSEDPYVITKINALIDKDMEIIMNTLKIIEEVSESNLAPSFEVKELKYIAILADEVPELE